MGKGDVRTRKGKINNGSYGKKRSREDNRIPGREPVTTSASAAASTKKK